MKKDYIEKVKKVLGNFANKFKELSLKKKLVAIGALLVVVYVIVTSGGSDSEITYQTEEVKKGNVVNIVSETGEISTAAKTSVTSTITGIVKEVYVENGDEIWKGQNLFRVESTATEAERATAYSTHQSAVSSLNAANNTYRSKQATVERVLDEVSGHDTDETLTQKETRTVAEVARDSAYDAVQSAEATVAKTWLAYQATIDGIVKSPANGVVANLSVASGQGVGATADALIVKSEGDTWITLQVNEVDISTVKKGQKATVSVDAVKDKELTGTVERVDDVGTVTSGVVTYNAYILVSETDESIRLGMTVQVDIQTQKKEDVLVVSNSAIKPYQGGKAIQVVDSKTDELIYLPIEIGIVGPTKSEVVSGLTEGQEIVVSQTTGSKEPSSGLLRVPGGR